MAPLLTWAKIMKVIARVESRPRYGHQETPAIDGTRNVLGASVILTFNSLQREWAKGHGSWKYA